MNRRNLLLRPGTLLLLGLLSPACKDDLGDPGPTTYLEVNFDSTYYTFDSSSVWVGGGVRADVDDPENTEVTWSNTTAGTAGFCFDSMVTTSGWLFGHYISVTTHKWRGNVSLVPGPNLVTVTATDNRGHVATATKTVTYAPPLPIVHIESPWGGSTYNSLDSPMTFSGTASCAIGLDRVEWTNELTGASGIASGTTDWSASVPLALGSNPIRIRAVDVLARVATDSMTVVYPAANPPPTLTMTEPSTTGTFTTSATGVLVKGTSSSSPYGIARVDCTCDETGLKQSNFGITLVFGTMLWNFWVPLNPGTNTIHITAVDGIGGTTTTTLVVTSTP